MNSKRKYGKMGVISILIFFFFVLNINKQGEYVFFDTQSNHIIRSLFWGGIFVWISRLAVWKEKCPRTSLPCTVLKGLGCLFFAFVSIAEKYYVGGVDFSPYEWFMDLAAGLKMAPILAGGFLFYWYLLDTIAFIIVYLRDGDNGIKIPVLVHFVGGKFVAVKSAAAILIIWIPQIIIRYPGAMNKDAWTSVYHYWNPDQWTSQHPVIYTLILGKLADVGLSFGHIEYGIFLLTIAQVIIHLLVFGYCISVMNHYHVSELLKGITWLFFALLPIFPAYATTVVIDSGYCAAFLLLIIEIYIWILDPQIFISSPKHWVLTIAGVAGMFLRYNGIYILLVLMGIVCIEGIRAFIQKRVKIPQILLLLVVLLTATFSFRAATTAMTNRHVAINISSRVKYAVIIQQIGRCTVKHPESFSETDIQDIEAVMGLSFETISEKYNPASFDNLKKKFNVNAGRDQMKRFLGVWLKMLRRHPMTCINATLEQNYYLFSIFARNCRYYSDFITGIEDGLYDYSDLYVIAPAQQFVQAELSRSYSFFESLPVIGLFVNQAIYTIILFSVFLHVFQETDRRNFILLFPLLGTLGICFLGPACRGHARYLYPLVYCMPVMLSSVVVKGNPGKL